MSKINAVVYTSKSGFTRNYAELLSKKCDIPAYDLASAPAVSGDIIYMGPLHAGAVTGYRKALTRYSVGAVCGVGMMPPRDGIDRELRRSNGIENPEVFYLQGGCDLTKLSGISRFMLSIVVKSIAKKLSKSTNRTPADDDLLELCTNGGSRVSEDNIAQLSEWTMTRI